MRVEPVSSYMSSPVYRKPTNRANSERIIIKDADLQPKSKGLLSRLANKPSESIHPQGIGKNFDKYA